MTHAQAFYEDANGKMHSVAPGADVPQSNGWTFDAVIASPAGWEEYLANYNVARVFKAQRRTPADMKTVEGLPVHVGATDDDRKAIIRDLESRGLRVGRIATDAPVHL